MPDRILVTAIFCLVSVVIGFALGAMTTELSFRIDLCDDDTSGRYITDYDARKIACDVIER